MVPVKILSSISNNRPRRPTIESNNQIDSFESELAPQQKTKSSLSFLSSFSNIESDGQLPSVTSSQKLSHLKQSTHSQSVHFSDKIISHSYSDSQVPSNQLGALLSQSHQLKSEISQESNIFSSPYMLPSKFSNQFQSSALNQDQQQLFKLQNFKSLHSSIHQQDQKYAQAQASQSENEELYQFSKIKQGTKQNQYQKNSAEGSQTSRFYLSTDQGDYQQEINFLSSREEFAKQPKRIKTLSNIPSTLKRIEEYNHQSSDYQLPPLSKRSELLRSIQFSSNLEQVLPSHLMSPLELLKKQPTKGVLKGVLKPARSLLNQNEQSPSQNENEQIKVPNHHRHHNLPSLSNQMETVNEEKAIINKQNKEQLPEALAEQIPSSIKRILRNGKIIKQIKAISTPQTPSPYILLSPQNKYKITFLQQ